MQDNTPTSRNIPLPIQRIVRQRCGFGCVLCGFPLYEYDHIIDWSQTNTHNADEITLLCDKHHKEKTNKLLPVEDVKKANEKPFCLRSGVSKPYDLHYSGNQCKMVIGSNKYISQCAVGGEGVVCPIVVDSVPLLHFVMQDGHLLLNANIFDEFNQLVLQIVNNQLIYSVSSWDIQLVGRCLTIREASRKILIEIKFETPNTIIINRGRFLFNGVEILTRVDSWTITNNDLKMSGNTYQAPCGIMVGKNNLGLSVGIYIPELSRYPLSSPT